MRVSSPPPTQNTNAQLIKIQPLQHPKCIQHLCILELTSYSEAKDSNVLALLELYRIELERSNYHAKNIYTLTKNTKSNET